MQPSRPQSFELAPGLIVRRDADNEIWRVFQNSRNVYSTAGTNGDTAEERAFAHALTLLPARI